MSALTINQAGSITHVIIDDGGKNVFTLPVVQELLTVAQQIEASEDRSTLLLQGNGAALSVGLDTATVLGGGAPAAQLLGDMGQLLRLLYLSSVRTVTIASGHATAAGAMLLLVSDYRIGHGAAGKIGLSEVRVGLDVPLPTQQLVKDRLATPYQYQATALASLYDYHTAHRAGYLDELVETQDAALTSAQQKAEQLAALNTDAYLKTKQGMRQRFAELLG